MQLPYMFLFLKHLIGGFCYHFWTKAFPKLKRGKKPDLSTLSKPDLEKVDRTVKAIESFINLAGIAMGLLQYLALTQTQAIRRGCPKCLASWILFHSLESSRLPNFTNYPKEISHKPVERSSVNMRVLKATFQKK